MIENILTAAGVKHRQARFPQPPADTYAVYFDDVEIEAADPVGVPLGVKLPRIYRHSCRVELYEPKPDPTAEASIEAELDAWGLIWAKEDRYWLQDVQRYQVLYTFDYTNKE